MAAKKYSCDPCNLVFPTNRIMKDHLKTRKHLDNAAGTPAKLRKRTDKARFAANIAARKYCRTICDTPPFTTQQILDKHNRSQKHLRAVVAATNP